MDAKDGYAMAMTIMNDASAAMTLGELNKNISALGKQLKKVSSGQRINGAGDGPSEYSISEKMRVRIRALDQDERNVLNGAALLKTAEGAIQQQIEIMKTIKEKVIDADNDTNTDLDRMTIQKEIDHGYQQIEDIAQETNYNGKRLLVGDTVKEVIRSWIVMDDAVMEPDSDDLKLINGSKTGDPYFTPVSDKYQPFKEWGTTSSQIDALGLAATNDFTGGKTESTPKTITFDLSTANFDDLLNNGIGVGFTVTQCAANSSSTTTKYFVLTTDSSAAYNVKLSSSTSTTANNIVVGAGWSKNQIADAMVSSINSNFSSNLLQARRDGEKVILETKAKNDSNPSGYIDISFENYCNANGFGCQENPSATLTTYTYTYEATTGQFSTYGSDITGGNYASGPTPENPDALVVPARPDTLTRNVSGVESGKGVRVYGPSGTVKLAFVDGDSGYDSSAGTIGKNYNGSATIAGLSVTMNGSGQITFSTPHSGYTYRVYDGLSSTSTPHITTIAVKRVDSLTATVGAGRTSVNAAKSVDTPGTCALDLSSYAGADADLEDFIDDLKGKIITWNYPSSISDGISKYNSYKSSYTFIDTGGDDISPTITTPPSDTKYTSRSIDVQSVSDAATAFDLNELRGMFDGSKTVAEVAAAWLKGKLGSRVLTHDDNPSIDANKVMFKSQYTGPAGNSDKLTVTEGHLRSWEIDFATALAGKSIPEDLDGKGFRLYCATHHGQWFNFEFVNGMESLDDKPLSGTDSLDIKTLLIDVSGVHNVNELLDAIYDKTMPKLTGNEKKDPTDTQLYWNHYMRVATDKEHGKLIVYDTRAKNVNTSGYEYQVDGAKLADGILDNVIKGKRNVYVKDLVIHHTDHASQNIHVRVPQTTLDHLFEFVPGQKEISEFNVLTAENREKLLGNKAGIARNGRLVPEEEKGYLDTALDYLTGANTLVGAQIMRLEMTQANIVTSRESTTNSESTIRDADMAKEMTGYTKANVLAQAAQSMLAQANQNSSGILNLLQ